MKIVENIFSNTDVPVKVTFINLYSVAVLNKKTCSDFHYVLVDSFLLIWLSNCFRRAWSLPRIQRHSFDFSSIAGEVFSHCESRRLSVLVVGGADADALSFKNVLKERYQNLNVTVVGGFDRSNLEKVASQSFDVAIFGMGCPLQEDFLLKYAANKKYLFTCGGFVTQTATKMGDYYPNLFVVFNLRWLYRFLYEPHVMKRTIIYYPVGFFKFIRDRWYDLLGQ